MGRRISIPYYLRADPATKDFVTIYTIPKGKKAVLKKITIRFPAGTNGELRLALYYGHMKVAPETPYWNGNDVRFIETLNIPYWSQDPVLLWYENVNTTAIRESSILIEAELE